MRDSRLVFGVIGFMAVGFATVSASHAQTSAETNYQSSSRGVSQRVIGLVDIYYASSDIMKQNVARRIDREVQPLRGDLTSYLPLALADIVLSHQAATTGRRDLALSRAREAVAMAARITTPNRLIVQTRAASALARAFLSQESHLDAIRVTSAARRAFGPLGVNPDPAIDELMMWDSIVLATVPTHLASQVRALALSDDEANALSQSSTVDCKQGGQEIERNRQEGSAAVFPVVSGLNGIGGGAVTRSSVDSTGKVMSVLVTAFAPTEGFAAAAQIASRTWKYTIPAGTPDICRSSLQTIFAFGFE